MSLARFFDEELLLLGVVAAGSLVDVGAVAFVACSDLRVVGGGRDGREAIHWFCVSPCCKRTTGGITLHLFFTFYGSTSTYIVNDYFDIYLPRNSFLNLSNVPSSITSLMRETRCVMK